MSGCARRPWPATFPFPVKYGYAAVGRVETGRELAGKTVFALHPHQIRVQSCRRTWRCSLPEGVTPQRAVLAANMETALNAVWDAAPRARRSHRRGRRGRGRRAGRLSVRAASRRGRDADRHRPVARGDSRSARRRVRVAAEGAARLRRRLSHQRQCAGPRRRSSSPATRRAIVEMSWYGAGTVGLALGGAFHSRRLKLISSQVGQVAPSHRPRWTHRRRLAAALALLAGSARSTRCSRLPSPSTTCRPSCRAS